MDIFTPSTPIDITHEFFTQGQARLGLAVLACSPGRSFIFRIDLLWLYFLPAQWPDLSFGWYWNRYIFCLLPR